MELFTVSEVAEIFKVKNSTIYAWVKNGSLPSININGQLRFDRVDIDRVIEGSKTTILQSNNKVA